MSLPLPPELIREIIYFTLSSAPPVTPEYVSCSTKSSWHAINALSLTTRTYRALALEAWFSTLRIESPEDLEFVRCCWPEVGARWTRHLHCVQTWFKPTASPSPVGTSPVFCTSPPSGWIGFHPFARLSVSRASCPSSTSPLRSNTLTCADCRGLLLRCSRISLILRALDI